MMKKIMVEDLRHTDDLEAVAGNVIDKVRALDIYILDRRNN